MYVTCLRINGPKCPNCRGLDSRCRHVELNFEFEPIYPSAEDISIDENIFDTTSDFDMEIQEMLLNMVDTTNIVNPNEITVNE